VVLPFLERGDRGRFHSSAAVFDADGTQLGVARRQHVTDREGRHLAAGPGHVPVFDTAAGRVGVVLGQDRHLPEVARILGLQGAELILFPSAATTDRPRVLQEAEPLAVASQNACWVGLVNRVGEELLRGSDGAGQVTEYAGGSYLADARGRFLARASRDQPAIIRADLPLSRLQAERARNPPHALRRPGIYHPLVDM
jgi:beta-ureidopropionase